MKGKEELLVLIREESKNIIDVRKGPYGVIEVRLSAPDDERAWINKCQAPSKVEAIINTWMRMGGGEE